MRHDHPVDPAVQGSGGPARFDGILHLPDIGLSAGGIERSGGAQRSGWVATMIHRLPVGRLNTKVSANGDATLLARSPLAS